MAEGRAVHDDDTLDAVATGSVERRRMQASLEQRLFESAPPTIKVGRFVLVDVLGRGSNGIVYRAFDTDLDRVLAVKVLALDSESHRARLLREAKALARLNHPNVVAIYEVGEERGQVFLAMEHVDGGSLAQWCAKRPERGRDEVAQVCAMFEQCARGLAAAHAAGIVHRDLKPGNILVGSDGRARLADFGLARADARGEDGDVATVEAPPMRSASSSGSEPLTATGAVLGTPAYMAPEQLRGQADERSDQFGLCAAFFEALFGVRAHAGDDRAVLYANVEAGRIVPVSRGAVPEYVRRVLLRGLSPRPEQRFASIDAMLVALDRGRRRRRVPLLVGVASTAVIGGWLALAGRPDPIAPCAIDPIALDGAWGPARREAVRQAIVGSGAPYAMTTWSRISEALDAAAARWAQDELGACRAARDPDPERAALGQARLVCGARAIGTFEAATAALATADAATLPDAGRMTDALGDLIDCTTPREIDSAEGMRLAVLADRAVLARRLNRPDEGERLAREVLAASEPGTLPRLRASAHLALADLYTDRGDHAGKRAALHAALTEAELADDPELLARSWGELAVVAADAGDPDDARFFLARAKRLEAGSGLAPWARAALLHDEAEVEQHARRYAEAAELFAKAVTLLEVEQDDGLDHAFLLVEYAAALEYAGNVTEAIAIGERAVARFDELLGADHPLAAVQRGRVGRIYGFLELEERVEAELVRVQAVLEANPGFRPDVRAIFYDDLAQAQANLQKYDDALANVGRAVAVWRALHGDDAIQLEAPLSTRSRILLARGDGDGALAAADQALAVVRREPNPDVVRSGELQLRRAEALAQLHRVDEARAAASEARALLATVYEPGSGFELQTTQRVASVLGVIGDTEAARAMFEDAIVRAEHAGAGSYVGRFHWELARIEARASRWSAARERLARSRAAHVAFGSPQPILDEIDAMERELPR